MTRTNNQSEIVMLPVSQIFPHPDNPRKDVGDITELAESIKTNGILQNLTVVKSQKGYTVIIGHRRLAAAKKAGLETVPCIVADMSMDEQISTMLVENMQRADLTVYEQAKAFQQLSIDFGMTVPEIAEMSGFSETTVRRRTKLAELDEKAFKKACDRGATLFDFAELDKIEDPAERQKVLEAAGTVNFKNALKNAIDKQKDRKKLERFEEQVAQFATKIEKRGANLQYCRSYGTWTSGEAEKPGDADSMQYYYTVDSCQISLYKKSTPNSEEERKAREREAIRQKAEANWGQACEIVKRHRQLRQDFVQNLSVRKEMADIIARNAADILTRKPFSGGYWNVESMCRALGIGYDEANMEPNAQEFKSANSKNPLRTLLILICWHMERYGSYINQEWNRERQCYEVVYQDSPALDSLYGFLEELGYERSDEEWQMSGGTHPIFEKGGAK